MCRKPNLQNSIAREKETEINISHYGRWARYYNDNQIDYVCARGITKKLSRYRGRAPAAILAPSNARIARPRIADCLYGHAGVSA